MRINHILITTSLGLGFSPVAPGTAGALGGCLIAYLITRFTEYNVLVLPSLIVLFFFLGVHSSNKMENLKGGWGVMMDDVLAGIYANLIIQLFILIKASLNG